MGLDMMLYRYNAEDRELVFAPINYDDAEWEKLYDAHYERVTQVAYWRKVNQVHGWFVRLAGGTDECQMIPVEAEQLAGLVATCKAILADPTRAQDLPLMDGFFFGDRTITDYYFEGLQQTVDQIEKALAELDPMHHRFYYQASW